MKVLSTENQINPDSVWVKTERIPDYENLHQPFNNLDFEITNLQKEMIAFIVSAHLGFRLDYNEFNVSDFNQQPDGRSIIKTLISRDGEYQELELSLQVK